MNVLESGASPSSGFVQLLKHKSFNAVIQAASLGSEVVRLLVQPVDFDLSGFKVVPFFCWLAEFGRWSIFGELSHYHVLKMTSQLEAEHGMRFERHHPIRLNRHVCYQLCGDKCPIQLIASVACLLPCCQNLYMHDLCHGGGHENFRRNVEITEHDHRPLQTRHKGQ